MEEGGPIFKIAALIYPGQIQDKNEQKNLYLLPYKFRLDKYINAER